MSEILTASDTIIIQTGILVFFIVLNIIFLSRDNMMVRFLFALFTLVIAATSIANSAIPFHPYLQMMAVVMSLICMFLAAKAKG